MGEWRKWTTGVPSVTRDKVPLQRCQESQALTLLAKSLLGCPSPFLSSSASCWVAGYLGLPAHPLQPSGCMSVALGAGASETALFPSWLRTPSLSASQGQKLGWKSTRVDTNGRFSEHIIYDP